MPGRDRALFSIILDLAFSREVHGNPLFKLAILLLNYLNYYEIATKKFAVLDLKNCFTYKVCRSGYIHKTYDYLYKKGFKIFFQLSKLLVYEYSTFALSLILSVCISIKLMDTLIIYLIVFFIELLILINLDLAWQESIL